MYCIPNKLSKEWVVTAAHCTDKMKSREIVITVGHLTNSYYPAKREDSFQESDVAAIIEHPSTSKQILLFRHY